MTAIDALTAARYADLIRLRAVRMVAPHGFGYLGQALSSAELFATLYAGHYDPGRDSLVVSPGHYIIAAFAAAPEVGLLGEEALATYGFDESALEAIGTERSPAVDLTGGSLGMGLSGAAGLALADRLQGRAGRAGVRGRQRRRAGGGPGLGGGAVRRAQPARLAHRPA